VLRLSVVVLIIYAALLSLTGWLFDRYPVGFIPKQDQGWLLVNIQLPDSASVQRARSVLLQMDQIARATPGVAHTAGVAGLSLLLTTNSSNFASMFIILDPFDKREKHKLTADVIMARLREEYAREIKDATFSIFGAPPVPGIGVAGGFKLMVEDRGSLGPAALARYTDALADKAREHPHLIIAPPFFRADTPQLYMDIDRTKTESLGVPLSDLNTALQVFLGSVYVNNFNAFGRSWQVNIQADGSFRNHVRGLNQFQVRNISGQMVPIGTLIRMRDDSGPVMITRYNLRPSAPVMGGALPGMSSGQAIAFMEDLAGKTLPRSMATEWTELTFMQIKAGNTAIYIFASAVVFVFLVLAAQYESWALPLAVILVVPLCLLCSLVGVALRRLPMDLFVQTGFVVLVGLACKNAILIVEFAKARRGEGAPGFEATADACRLRLRPILMTSLAFILGVVPMVVAEGAGAEMRWSLGTAVFSGMLGVTLFGIFLTPLFFYVIDWFGGFPLFHSRVVRMFGSVVVGGTAGLAIGFLLWKAGFGELHWSLVGGFGLGALAALLVLRGRRAKPELIPTAPRATPVLAASAEAKGN
jgi:multidrug efflux pump